MLSNTSMLTDGSPRHDGIFPAVVLDHDGTSIDNPMGLNLERQGLTCPFLDLLLTFTADGQFTSTVYQKRDAMPVFRDYRRFPHMASVLSDKARYGVFVSQLHRFVRALPCYGS